MQRESAVLHQPFQNQCAKAAAWSLLANVFPARKVALLLLQGTVSESSTREKRSDFSHLNSFVISRIK